MLARNDNPGNPEFNFAVNSVFNFQSLGGGAPLPPSNTFFLLDGSEFLLLDNTQFLLLGT